MMQSDVPSRARRRAFFGAVGVSALLSALILGLFYWLDRPPVIDPRFAATTGEYLESHAKRPPRDTDGWRATEIPGGPGVRTDEPFRSVWYRIPVSDKVLARQGQLAVYFYQPLANLDVYIGDELIGSGGPMSVPLPFYNRQLVFPFERAQVVASDGYIYYRVARKSISGASRAVFVGPLSAFQPFIDLVVLWALWIPSVIVAVMLTLATLLSFLYLLRRQDSAYGLYALVVGIWALQICHQIVQQPLLPFLYWYVAEYVMGWWVLLTAIFIHRFFNLKRPRVERAILISGVGMSLLLFGAVPFVSQLTLFVLCDAIWLPMQQFWGVYALSMYAYVAWQRGDFESTGMLAMAGVSFIVGARDIMFLIVGNVPGSTFYLLYVAPLQMLFFTMLLARRFATSVRQTEDLNRSLEERVQKKSQELAALERENTLAQERTRLMRDMHDGLGGQLVQAIALSEREATSERLRASLDDALSDLRTIIDSLSPEQTELTSVLAACRERIERVLAAAQIRLRWQIADLPAYELSPELSLGILRIVQEAASNAARHSRAENLTLRGADLVNSVRVELQDDGVGFDVDTATAGYGLRNMRARATDLGFSLTVLSSPSGTLVRIDLPRTHQVEAGHG